MLSRITDSEQHTAALRRLYGLASSRDRAQEALATGRRIHRVSDDPAAATRAVTLRADVVRVEQHAQNALSAEEWNDFAGSLLQDVSSALARVRELAVQGANDTLGQSGRDSLAEEIDQILGQVIDLGNTQVAGRSLFGGGAPGPVFVEAPGGSGVNAFRYAGSSEVGRVVVGEGIAVDLGMPGDDVFLVQDRATTRYVGGATGARAGTGTDSATGFGQLTVAHSATTLGDGALAGGDSVSNLRLGASTAQDSVLGAHSIQIDSAGTVSLNGGPAVAFTAADTDLALTGPDGAVVHLDLSGVTPGSAHTVAVQGDGTLSVDGGVTTTAIDFSGNQIVRHGSEGTVTNIDSSGIRTTGQEQLTYEGTFGVLGALVAIRDDLRNERGLDPGDQAQEISQHLAEIERSEETLGRAFAKLGTASSRSASAQETAESLKIRLEQLRSSAEDADIVESILEFQRSEQAYEASLQATGQSRSLSLLSFLR